MKDCYNFLGMFFKVKCSYLLHIYIKKTPQRCYITILYIIYINIFCNDGFISSVDIFAVLTSGFSIRLIHIEPVFHQVLDLQVTDCDGLLHIRWCSQHDITQTWNDTPTQPLPSLLHRVWPERSHDGSSHSFLFVCLDSAGAQFIRPSIGSPD